MIKLLHLHPAVYCLIAFVTICGVSLLSHIDEFLTTPRAQRLTRSAMFAGGILLLALFARVVTLT